MINSVRSNKAGERIASELPDAVYVQGDIGDPATAGRLVDAAVERWGRLDGLVNNAAMTVPTPLADLAGSTAEQWEQVLRVNVIGTFLVSQAALPHLRASGDGWIVNITSLAGVRQGGSSLPYATSKAAVNHLTTLMAKFTGPEVRVNAGRARTRRHAVDRRRALGRRCASRSRRPSRSTAAARPRTSPTPWSA